MNTVTCVIVNSHCRDYMVFIANSKSVKRYRKHSNAQHTSTNTIRRYSVNRNVFVYVNVKASCINDKTVIYIASTFIRLRTNETDCREPTHETRRRIALRWPIPNVGPEKNSILGSMYYISYAKSLNNPTAAQTHRLVSMRLYLNWFDIKRPLVMQRTAKIPMLCEFQLSPLRALHTWKCGPMQTMHSQSNSDVLHSSCYLDTLLRCSEYDTCFFIEEKHSTLIQQRERYRVSRHANV